MNIYDIAKKAGVSIATVSRVINSSEAVSDKTREKIKGVMKELGYEPNIFARGLVTNSMMSIGIMTIDVRDLYYSNAIYIIDAETRKMGYDVIHCSTGEDIEQKKKYLSMLVKKRVDGIILIGSVFKEKADNSHIIEAAKKVPVIMVNGYIKGDNIYSVLCDDYYGLYSTVEFLISKGHEDIVYIYDAETFSGSEKIRGFKQAMIDNKLKVGKYSIIKTSKGIDGGQKAVNNLIRLKVKFSAIIAAEDILAVGVLKDLDKRDIKVPDQVSVVGFNNSIISQCTTPELTSVENKVHIISKTAAMILMDAIEKKKVQSKTIIKPELIIRQTTN